MTAYEMRISDWSSDVCSSDLALARCRCAQGRVPANRKIAARCRYPATRSAQLQQPDRQRGGALMTRTKDQAAAVLPTLLKALRLPSINRHYIGRASGRERVGQ